MDLLDLYRGKLSWRRVVALLPSLRRDPSSALFASIAESLAEDLPDDPDAEEVTDVDRINAVLTARYGPLYSILRRIELNQRYAMYQQGHEDSDPQPQPIPLPADVLVRVREVEMLSLDSDIARAYFASLQG